ncbi:GNAT family N-acetyltransferase [Novosphingobium sp. Gsoil 351]|uniref:GNAT family N-acetyltransferase n=1 Tax=Novosphingobium sp. Gsoil 351 TaxID=2675225 RepID=UPI0012B47602|nr:GNAT family N-acetyltransferase [Novosphingobium sp. Gsoil 351]QGN53398.1 GNAT family N-acetyltransferase [Novosphingobium sp. Gsoil 351]
MTGHPLDRPVWSCVTGPLAHMAWRNGGAVRIDPAYGPFAAARDTTDASQADLAALLPEPDVAIAVVEPDPWPIPPSLRLDRSGELLQMVAERPVHAGGDDPRVELLDDGDATEMAALALATEPGPWAPLTHRYGAFFGIRVDGRLAAMAGERMRAGGFAEVSAVCTWPEFRGQGMAAALIRRVIRGFVSRGETPFLHSYSDNAGAIRLYETLGFRARRTMALTVLVRA